MNTSGHKKFGPLGNLLKAAAPEQPDGGELAQDAAGLAAGDGVSAATALGQGAYAHLAKTQTAGRPLNLSNGLVDLGNRIGVKNFVHVNNSGPAVNSSYMPGEVTFEGKTPQMAHLFNLREKAPGVVGEGVTAHELGHARMYEKYHRRFGNKALGGLAASRLLGPGMGSVPGLGTLLGAGSAAVGDDDWSKGLALAGTAAHIPTLLDEAAASHVGGRALGRRYLSAWRGYPTYLASAAAPMAAHYASRWARKKMKEKTAAFLPFRGRPTTPPPPVKAPAGATTTYVPGKTVSMNGSNGCSVGHEDTMARIREKWPQLFSFLTATQK